jgi:EAL domain-containing protein (putative c-di-GMP-specific phosphodiesterase class I)
MADSAHSAPLQDAVQGLGVRLRQSFPSCRVHLCSVHGPSGDVVWLSEGFLGPDESDAVLRAYEQFAARDAPSVVVHELGDGRSAVVLACRASRRHFGGSVLVVVDSKSLRSDAATDQFTAGPVAALLDELAQLLGPPVEDHSAGMRAAATGHGETDTSATAIGRRINLPIRATQVDAGVDRLLAALRQTPLSLYAQPIVPLREGDRERHYEVLIRSGDATTAAPLTMLARATKAGLASMIDRRVLTMLLAWAKKHLDSLQASAVVLSVNLSATALRDEHFGRFLELCLAKARLPKGLIAFEISEQACLEQRNGLTALTVLLERLQCSWGIDDFTGSRASLELLRLRGLTTVKLAPTLTERLSSSETQRRDLSDLLQITRMLGIASSAKGVNDPRDRTTLSELGVARVQSFADGAPSPIDAVLASGPAPGPRDA